MPYFGIEIRKRAKTERLEKHEILHALRTGLEERHRVQLDRHTFRPHTRYDPKVEDPSNVHEIPDMDIAQADECCNKTVPFYVCVSSSERTATFGALQYALHNWLYKEWFVPYRSDIEWGQFIGKIFILHGKVVRGCSDGFDYAPKVLVNMTVKLNALICDRVKAARQDLMAMDSPPNWPYCDGLVQDQSIDDLKIDQEHFHLLPLFRAVNVLIHDDDFDLDMDIADMLVYVIRTGVEDGLSAPIQLDSIRGLPVSSPAGQGEEIRAVYTTLQEALVFIKELQGREEAAFGKIPDPRVSTRNLRAGYLERSPMGEARSLGWRPEFGELAYPSSEWVDKELYPTYFGCADNWDFCMKRKEKEYRKYAAQGMEEWLTKNKKENQKPTPNLQQSNNNGSKSSDGDLRSTSPNSEYPAKRIRLLPEASNGVQYR